MFSRRGFIRNRVNAEDIRERLSPFERAVCHRDPLGVLLEKRREQPADAAARSQHKNRGIRDIEAEPGRDIGDKADAIRVVAENLVPENERVHGAAASRALRKLIGKLIGIELEGQRDVAALVALIEELFRFFRELTDRHLDFLVRDVFPQFCREALVDFWRKAVLNRITQHRVTVRLCHFNALLFAGIWGFVCRKAPFSIFLA